ncbi:MAG: hypothetical protein H2069_04705 [Legionella sp.]|nr:hypothetical protein [Legionella sp.]
MKESYENRLLQSHRFNLFTGYNDDAKNVSEITQFIRNLSQKVNNVFLLEQPKVNKQPLDLTAFFSEVLKNQFEALANGGCSTYLFRLDSIGISIKETMVINETDQIKGGHAVVLHFKKENNNLQIFLDDSLESKQFKLLKNLIETLSKEKGYSFYAKNFGNFYAFQTFHGSSNSHFSVLYLLEQWAFYPQKMREHLNQTPIPSAMFFCDLFPKLKAFSTKYKHPEIINLVNDYKIEIEAINREKIKTMIANHPTYVDYFAQMTNDYLSKLKENDKTEGLEKHLAIECDMLIKKIIEYSKQKKGQEKPDSLKAKENLQSIPRKIDRTALFLCMENCSKIRAVISENYTKITHLKTFQQVFNQIRERCSIPSDDHESTLNFDSAAVTPSCSIS